MNLLNKIKLCIIIPGFKCGGSERFISVLCNHINTSLFHVELYVLDGADPSYQITNPQVKVYLLNIKNVRKSLFSVLKIIKKSKPHILFTASNHLNIFISIFRFLMPRKVNLVARESSIVSINNKRVKYGKFYEWLVKTFYKNIDYIICQSAYMQQDLIKNYNIKKEKTIVIHNPVEEIKVHDTNGKSQRITNYKFFTVGRLSPEKGIDRLLKALSLIKIDYTFYIIGDGPEKNNLQQLAGELNLADKIFFEGQKSHPYENMADADLFLIGSHYEGLPNVLLEAGMLGIPVAGYSAPGGIGEIIINGVNGFLADDKEGKSLDNTILMAINHSFDKQAIINVTKSKFSIDKILPQFEGYFIKIYQKQF